MRHVLIIVVLTFLVFVVNVVQTGLPHPFGDEAVMVLGFVLIGAWIVGRMTARLRMPMITGYLLAGLVFGQHVIGHLSPNLTIFSERALDQLSLIDGLALGLIAFTAGGELRVKDVMRRIKSIGAITVAQAVVVLVGVGGVIMLASSLLPFLDGQPHRIVLATALLLGMAAVAKSPATTVAVITEMGARGPMAQLMLAVTVVKDVVVLMLFSVGLITARILLDPAGGADTGVLLHVLWEVVGSLAIGILLGWLLSFYIRLIGRDLPVLVLTLSFLAMYLAGRAALSGILICMSAGFFVENFTDYGNRLIKAIERYSLPVYIVFFTVAGAKINVPALQSMWAIALVLIVSRLLFTFIGTWLGSRLTGGNNNERRLLWMGFIGQAGVTLGLASIIARTVPGIGGQLQTLIIATIAVNQIIGPILLRLALVRGGEARITD